MNKFLKLFCGAAVVATMAACSSDEPNVGPNGPEGNGEVAYMKVQINAPQTGTRTTDDGGYVESDLVAKEHAVKSVDFLFFQADGAYAFTVKADNSTFVPENADDSNGNNVEYIGENNIVVLEGVTQNNYPEYVMTILNCPSTFSAGQTLEETADKLATFATDFNIGGTEPDAPFVMTTSSFFGEKKGTNGGDRHDAKYFVTKLNKTDFMTTLDQAKNNPNPVEIYVERLAAKVELGLTTQSGLYEEVNGVKYFKLNQTLAGGNDNTTTGDPAVSDVDLYIAVEGWGLNAIASQSYMSKKLDADWEENAVYTGWNNANDWRSFWGQAWTYGAFDQSKFTYKSLKDIYGNKQTATTNTVEYCYENTNAPANIFSPVANGPFWLGTQTATQGVENARVTHVVLRTKIYEKKDGVFSPINDLVQYRGVLYTGASFKALVLNAVKAKGELNFWKYNGSSTDPSTDVTTTSWKSIDVNDIEIVQDKADGHKLGEIKVVAKALTGDAKIYQRTVVKEPQEDGTTKDVVKYVPFANSAAYEEALNTAMAGVYASYDPVGTDSADAIYYIPIEHNAKDALTQGTPIEAKEAYYGVVRNHWYKLTINSFKKVGHLVFDPEDDETQIIPDKPEDPLYYVGARINILSWKVINQSVNDL